VTALGLPRNSEVLAPAYHHGSEIEALERSGLVVRFYSGNPRLEPEEDELEELAGPATTALHLTHFLGFPQDSRRWREWCDRRGLALIEDCAPAWLSSYEGRPVGSFGHLAVFSLYKQIGVPDGGAAICSRPLKAPDRTSSLGLEATIRRHGAWLAQRFWTQRGGPRNVAEVDPARDFTLGDPQAPPTRMTRLLLPRVPTADVAARRRHNCQRLLDRLADYVPQPFEHLPGGASPWMLPISVPDKAALLSHLAREGILAIDHWSVPHPSLRPERFPEIAQRRRSTVALPVHQGLGDSDMNRISSAVVDALSG
jgi:dTDP-4-amino-4,6-dideoxygalactose transaminase